MKTILRKALLPLVVTSSIFSMNAYSDEGPSLLFDGDFFALIAAKDTFYIEVIDQVTGGCLPQPSRIKDQLEIVLRQNNFKITKDSRYFNNTISLAALGYAVGDNSCAVHLHAELYFPIVAGVPYAEQPLSQTFVTYRYEIGSVLLTGTKSDMQKRLEERARGYGEALFLDISRAKDDFGSKFPDIFKRQMEESQ